MKFVMTLASLMMLSFGAFAMDNTLTTTAAAQPTMANTLSFNFIGLSQGKANVYFDIGGISERIAPELSFRSYSNQEFRKDVNQKATVDRSMATLGASIKVFQRDNKSILVSPYFLFGTEKDAKQTENVTGYGARVIGQIYLNKSVALQAGLDGNNMETAFKGEGFAL
jgi:hypothetical protein